MSEMLEIRDPVHVFIRVYRDERQWLVDSEPMQRLRDIHQLAMTYLLYPGASHKRFEHTLGVLELATKIFDRVSDPQRIAHLPEGNPVIEELNRLLKIFQLLRRCKNFKLLRIINTPRP